MSDAQGPSRPSTPTTTEIVIHHVASPQAPKEPKSRILGYLQPTVYKPEADDMPKAPKTILDALIRAGICKCTTKPKGESTDVKYSAPRKLTVSVVDGKTDRVIHKYVPTRLLMGISARAAEILEAKPWAGKFKIHGKYEPAAMNSVIYAIILSQKMPVNADLTANLLKYEACLRLGIPSTHSSVKPLLTAINTQISTTTITSEVLTFIAYHLGSQDPVFTHMANVLCHQRFKGAVEDVKACGKMVARKPALQKAMVHIDQAHEARREAINASKRNRTKKSEDESGAESLVGATLKNKAAIAEEHEA
ncbi:hypothetical protein BU25DRAFT_490759 [Macroventuria anomochaeta]|uniref:Uncharacterized protein n=1 Tax=Macroventuria anomochaeta TaxID=301207 RepID=A0ACB6S418_9PLEO|nr:uncharacterized protein BU25DRAFT_490759 [Macroventuria anomochaeta]KAF2628118.1 hypothetical protein BU25DRAFT_490759 [Macroventuria anomochaeta]